MKIKPEWLAFHHAYTTCQTHCLALGEALNDLEQRKLRQSDLENQSKEDRRLLDQFAYRYMRLQDDLGAKLIPAILSLLGEEVASVSMLDRLARMEQLGWLPDADEWLELRRIRNEFTHDYPDTLAVRFERLQLALTSAQRVLAIFHLIQQKTQQRFPDTDL